MLASAIGSTVRRHNPGGALLFIVFLATSVLLATPAGLFVLATPLADNPQPPDSSAPDNRSPSPITSSRGLVGSTTRVSPGGSGSLLGSDRTPAVAYNSTYDEYLVVWSSILAPGQSEIFARRLVAATGVPTGTLIPVTDHGASKTASYAALDPAVAYNSQHNEYLVVWSSDAPAGNMADDELEIFSQRLDADGTKVGGRVRLSTTGADGDTSYKASRPAVAYNPSGDQYLVAWDADDDTSTLAPGANEIFARRVSGASGQVGSLTVQVSRLGIPDTDAGFDGFRPAIAANSRSGEFLVVWHGDDERSSPELGVLVDGDVEIFGQRLSATAALIGEDSFRISRLGPDGQTGFDALAADVAYDRADDRYLVVWEGEEAIDEKRQIFGELLDADGGVVVRRNAQGQQAGAFDDLVVGSMLADDARYDAYEPAVTFSPGADEFLISWRGDYYSRPVFEPGGVGVAQIQLPRPCFGGPVDDEFEIYGQRISAASGWPAGRTRFSISDVQPCGNADHDALHPAVVARSPAGTEPDSEDVDDYLMVWQADPGSNDVFDVYSQRLSLSPLRLNIANQFTVVGKGIDDILIPIGDVDNPDSEVELAIATTPNLQIQPPTTSGNPRQFDILEPETARTGAITVTLTRRTEGNDYIVARDSFSVTAVDRDAPPWLVMLYLAGDDAPPGPGQASLSEEFVRLIGRLAQLDENPALALAVLYDGRQPGDGRLLTRGPDETTLTEHSLPGAWVTGGDLNMGSDQQLRDFVLWARQQYPGAERSMLAIVGHGDGWSPDFGGDPQPGGSKGQASYRGLAIDFAGRAGELTALSTHDTGGPLFNTLGQGVDVLFFDACLMGMIETAYEVAPYAQYLVAGQNLLWAELPYEHYLAPQNLTGDTEPDQLARSIVRLYNPSNRSDEPFAIAAVALSGIRGAGGLTAKVDTLAKGLAEKLPDDQKYALLHAAYQAAQKFDYDASLNIDVTDGYVDLVDFVRKLRQQPQLPAELQDEAEAVEAAALAVLLERRTLAGSIREGANIYNLDFAGANGLSIYLPLGERDCRPTGAASTSSDTRAVGGCAAPPEPSWPVGLPTIEPQLLYYSNQGQAEGCPQLGFSCEAHGWVELLERLDQQVAPRDPNKPYNLPSLLRSARPIYLSLIRS
jgi:hypothetical protein